MTVDKDALLASDHAHLIHPLHNKAGHQRSRHDEEPRRHGTFEA